ncbi:small subunit ribosomal protein S17e [Strigomonas culicis]|uniref:Small subunit ribosomal protein S17e n=2 Tax=Strigomonas culicis TaxID=28005 RepID=S9TU91_9TRYP|nr:small subunit ribosomal protein S17e [Strigomonas culicis]|eukprot:EPY20094.1 small subunit ribosomal protein S17e [Strigomonas culicis]
MPSLFSVLSFSSFFSSLLSIKGFGCFLFLSNMGKIRTKTVKRASRLVVEKYFSKLNNDFYRNKRVIMDVTITRSKKLKNKIAGYTTHIMKRLARGPVRGISLKLQEEERERRMDFVPAVSQVDQIITDGIKVDKQTHEMLSKMEVGVPRYVSAEAPGAARDRAARARAPKPRAAKRA